MTLFPFVLALGDVVSIEVDLKLLIDVAENFELVALLSGKLKKYL